MLVAATGNNATSSSYNPANGIYYPAACTGVIAVGATGRYDGLAEYSNYGPQVDIVAPGGDGSFGILSTYPNDRFAYLTGTSMASPYVQVPWRCCFARAAATRPRSRARCSPPSRILASPVGTILRLRLCR